MGIRQYAISLIVTVALCWPATASAFCLSKSEARKLWPTRHLYWYSSDRCWSNRRGPPRGIKVDPVPPDPALPRQTMAKEVEEPQDKCCWPKLDTDAAGNVIQLLRSFIERWNDQPWIRP